MITNWKSLSWRGGWRWASGALGWIGLITGAPLAPLAPAPVLILVPASDLTVVVPAPSLTVIVSADDRTITVPAE